VYILTIVVFNQWGSITVSDNSTTKNLAAMAEPDDFSAESKASCSASHSGEN